MATEQGVLRHKVLDLFYGEGTAKNPRRLLVNPNEVEPTKWIVREARDASEADLDNFSAEELVVLLEIALGEARRWRISNERAKMSADIRAEKERVDRDNKAKMLVAFCDNDATRPTLFEQIKLGLFTKADVVAAYSRLGRKVHDSLTK